MSCRLRVLMALIAVAGVVSVFALPPAIAGGSSDASATTGDAGGTVQTPREPVTPPPPAEPSQPAVSQEDPKTREPAQPRQ